jgi:hypothetical protein
MAGYFYADWETWGPRHTARKPQKKEACRLRCVQEPSRSPGQITRARWLTWRRE